MKVVAKEDLMKRLEDIRLASEDCKTLAEVTEITGFSNFIINSLFKKFPEEAKEIRAKLEKNKGISKSRSKSRHKNTHQNTDTSVKGDVIPEAESQVEAEEEKKTNITAIFAKTDTAKSAESKVVMIDTSICHVENLFELLEEYVQNGYVLGVTDIVLDELDKLAKRNTNNEHSKLALTLLNIIMQNLASFKLFEAKEEKSHDDLIISTCDTNHTKLLTADKVMFIKASLKGISAKYVLSTNEFVQKKFKFNLSKKAPKNNLHPLANAKIREEKLIFLNNRKNQFVKIFSKTGEEKNGTEVSLEVGDRIFISTEKEDFITFADYEVYFSDKNLFYVHFHCRSYKSDAIVNVPDFKYKKFIEQARKQLIK